MIRFLKHFSRGNVELERIGTFSDAVFGIIITLLVLEFKVPSLHEAA